MVRHSSSLSFSSYCFIFLLCLVGRANADQIPLDQPLPLDPVNLYGQFGNGLTYIVRHNPNPQGKVVLYLEVRSGALNETDEQNGLAHFLEHMAFKGSAHSKPEQLIPFLTHMGMMFGADTNAHTNLWETVFKLTMPDVKPETIDTALTIFSDYASALLLSNVQIESERRVILEEIRARKNVQQRLYKEATQRLFAGTRLEIHDVLGDESLIKTFPRSEFVDYWNTWYRPENITLVVAGDVDPAAVVAQAKIKLGTFAARAPKRPALKAGLEPFESPRAIVVTDPDQVSGQVELYYLGAARPPVTTFGQYRRKVIEEACEWIVDRRFDELIEQGKAPFREAYIDQGDFLGEGFLFGTKANGRPQDWKSMLEASIAEIHQGLDHGFTQYELNLCRRKFLADAEWDVKTESSVDSTSRVIGIASAVGLNRPIMSAGQNLTLLHDILDGLRPEELSAVFAEDFGTRNYAYVLKLPAPTTENKLPAEQDILAAANAAWAQKTAAPEEIAQDKKILATEPSPGQVTSVETDADSGLTTATFANGVVLHHKFTDYRKDQVLVQITLPGGILEETAENRGISAAASVILSHPATSRLTSKEIRDLLTGKDLGLGGNIGEDKMAVGLTASPADLPLGMQLAYAILTDPVLEPAALNEWKKREFQSIASRPTRGDAQISEATAKTIFGGDLRMLPLTNEIVERQSVDSAQDWFKHISGHAAIEVAIVGDIQKSDAIALAAKYLGSLPPRSDGFDAMNKFRTIKGAHGPYTMTVGLQSATPKSLVTVGFISCDERDPLRRPLALASLILSDQMIQRIRFHDQLVYSIRCANSPAVSIPGTGTLTASALTDPKNAERLADTITEIIKNFAANGPTQDELATAKRQIANQLVSQMPEPGFWVSLTGDMTYRGRPLKEIKELPGVFQTFTAEQLRDAVRKCVESDRYIRLEAVPQVISTQPASPDTRPAVH